MPKRKAHAIWNGTLKEGDGSMRLGSGAFEGRYSFASRFESGVGTNPEELIGAALAGCFSMALSLIVEEGGHKAQTIDTDAEVTIEKKGDGFAITSIALNTKGNVPGLDAEGFRKFAEQAKDGCPVSQALGGTTISVESSLA